MPAPAETKDATSSRAVQFNYKPHQIDYHQATIRLSLIEQMLINVIRRLHHCSVLIVIQTIVSIIINIIIIFIGECHQLAKHLQVVVLLLLVRVSSLTSNQHRLDRIAIITTTISASNGIEIQLNMLTQYFVRIVRTKSITCCGGVSFY